MGVFWAQKKKFFFLKKIEKKLKMAKANPVQNDNFQQNVRLNESTDSILFKFLLI